MTDDPQDLPDPEDTTVRDVQESKDFRSLGQLHEWPLALLQRIRRDPKST